MSRKEIFQKLSRPKKVVSQKTVSDVYSMYKKWVFLIKLIPRKNVSRDVAIENNIFFS
jgi:hypothetical protein